MLEQTQPSNEARKIKPEQVEALKGLADKVASNERMQHAIKAALAQMGLPEPEHKPTGQ